MSYRFAHSLCYRGSLTPWGPLPTEASRHSLHIALVSHLSPILYLRTRLSQFLEYLLWTIPTVSKPLCLQCGDQVQYAAVETRFCSDVWVDISGDKISLYKLIILILNSYLRFYGAPQGHQYSVSRCLNLFISEKVFFVFNVLFVQ